MLSKNKQMNLVVCIHSISYKLDVRFLTIKATRKSYVSLVQITKNTRAVKYHFRSLLFLFKWIQKFYGRFTCLDRCICIFFIGGFARVLLFSINTVYIHYMMETCLQLTGTWYAFLVFDVAIGIYIHFHTNAFFD